MSSSVLIGIDIGTSSTKSVVLSVKGEILGSAAQSYPVDTPRPGWAEQSPTCWVDAAQQTVRAAIGTAGVSPSSVVGIGLSGQMHGTVCVSAGGQPLRPAIIWADQRTSQEVAELNERLGQETLAAWTGTPLATGFMLPSWLWLRDNEPDVHAATRWLLLPKDYVRFRLTGEIGAEPSDASSTSLLDPHTRLWSVPLLEALRISPEVLPPIESSSAVAGHLSANVADEMGLPAGLPVVYGASDQAAQALGNGVITPGVLSSTIGTGGQLLAPTDGPVIDRKLRMHCFCHALDDLWHAETAMLSAGLSLRWLRDQVLNGQDYQTLVDAAVEVPTGAEGLIFLPYLAGERTPHMDSRARGGFVGLTLRHRMPHLVRAVMEGVVMGMRQGLELLASLGIPIDTVIASGGATRHLLWLQLQADIYNRPIRRACTEEAAAVGAAMLAGLGLGVYADADDAIEHAVRWHPMVVEPDALAAKLYAARYEVYCGMYPALRSVMHQLDESSDTA